MVIIQIKLIVVLKVKSDQPTPNVEAMAEIFKNSESPPDAAMSG